MARPLVAVTNPNLAGVIVHVTRPYGDWTPVTEGNALDGMKVADLKQYAADNDIDLGDAKKKAEIVEVIKTAQSEPAGQDSPDAGNDTEE